MSEAAANDVRHDQADDRADERAGDGEPTSDSASGPELGPPTAVESLIGALLEAGPEVAEHVVKAAQELLLAVQVIVDAADHAVQEQKTVRDARSGSDAAGDDAGHGDASVHHLDLAE